MPELPEVETILNGIKPHIENQTITNVIIRQPRLRWPIPADIQQQLIGSKITQLIRRGKYLLFNMEKGTAIIHLGMSGRLRIFKPAIKPEKHDHIDIEFNDQSILRFTDPRRFGAFLWTAGSDVHPLIAKLGIEPLTKQFCEKYLWERAKESTQPIKSLIMENKTVVGIGNIYATEALFYANIHPAAPANALSKKRIRELVDAIKSVLREAIKQGGTTLKDYVNSDGMPGFFFLKLAAYGRAGLPCFHCQSVLQAMVIRQRTTVYCTNCQLP